MEPWDLVVQGHYQQAVEGFSRQLEQSPRTARHAPVHNNRATAFLGLREYAAAAQDYAASIGLVPTSEHGYVGLGVCQWCLLQSAEALTSWRRGLHATYTDAAGGVTIPGLLLYAAERLRDTSVHREAMHLLRTRARWKQLVNWPGALVPYLLGTLSAEQFRAAAALPPSPAPLVERRRCQASFYLGVRALVDRDHTTFQRSMGQCATSTNGVLEHEYYLATWEVDRGFPELASGRPM